MIQFIVDQLQFLGDKLKDSIGSLSWIICAGIAGGLVSYFWSLLQKQRETEVAAIEDFYKVYGEFFAVWKLWNYQCDNEAIDTPPSEPYKLLERASALDGKAEAFLTKVTSERKLAEAQLDELGLLRQAFQSLRQHIRDDRPLDWRHSDHPQYKEFKNVSSRIPSMLFSWNIPFLSRRPAATQAADQRRFVTHNKHEEHWEALAGEELRRVLNKYVDKSTFTGSMAFELQRWVDDDNCESRQDDAPSCLRCEEEDLVEIHQRLQGLRLDSKGWVVPIRRPSQPRQDQAPRHTGDSDQDAEWLTFIPMSQLNPRHPSTQSSTRRTSSTRP